MMVMITLLPLSIFSLSIAVFIFDINPSIQQLCQSKSTRLSSSLFGLAPLAYDGSDYYCIILIARTTFCQLHILAVRVVGDLISGVDFFDLIRID